MKISVSTLSAYLFCPRKLFLQRVLALEEPPKESTVLGSLRHEIYDVINQSEEKIVTTIKEKIQYNELITTYKSFYSKALREKIIKNKSKIKGVNLDIVDVFKRTWPLILGEAETRANNIFDFMQKYHIYGQELWERLTPKIISEIRIDSDNLQLKGIVDKVEIYENGYVPIELKTGKMPKEGAWPGHKIQIIAYSMLIEEKFKTKVKEGFVNYLDAKQTRRITINPFMRQEILNLVKEVREMLKSHDLPNYCGNKNKCINCGLRETCYNEGKVSTLISELE
jgi:CRISPR-associated protein Cas4|tara:strand:- start:369 stop:1214 length:846 start_codon:yes stop_codon:yes gene_type:complete